MQTRIGKPMIRDFLSSKLKSVKFPVSLICRSPVVSVAEQFLPDITQMHPPSGLSNRQWFAELGLIQLAVNDCDEFCRRAGWGKSPCPVRGWPVA